MALAPTSLPLSDICSITTTIQPTAAAGPVYTSGLILTTDPFIPSSGANSRVQKFISESAVLSAGAGSTSDSYIGAQIWFANSSQPLYIGRQDLTAIGTVAVHVGGENYVVGDVVTVVQAGASGGQLQVTTVGNGGVVTGIAELIGQQGTNYAAATNLTTAGGTGTGLTIDISAIGETVSQAMSACRAASSGWFGCAAPAAQLADQVALLLWAESATPDAQYFGAASDAGSLVGSKTSGLLEVAFGASYQNSFLLASSTQNGGYPNNRFAGVAAMATYCSRMTGLANSAWNPMFKNLTGIYPEPVTETQLSAIQALNGNVLLSRSNGQYVWVERGLTPSGQKLSTRMLSRMFVSDLRYALVAVLAQNPVIHQDDKDQQFFIDAATNVCNKYRNIGWIGAGTYNGNDLLNLDTGTPLPAGFFCQSDLYVNQSATARSAGMAMPVYVTVLLAGQADYLTVGVGIQL